MKRVFTVRDSWPLYMSHVDDSCDVRTLLSMPALTTLILTPSRPPPPLGRLFSHISASVTPLSHIQELSTPTRRHLEVPTYGQRALGRASLCTFSQRRAVVRASLCHILPKTGEHYASNSLLSSHPGRLEGGYTPLLHTRKARGRHIHRYTHQGG